MLTAEPREWQKGHCYRVQVKPNSSKDSIEQADDGSLVLRLRAPAVEGQANKALLKYFKKKFGLRVRILKGDTSQHKVLECL